MTGLVPKWGSERARERRLGRDERLRSSLKQPILLSLKLAVARSQEDVRWGPIRVILLRASQREVRRGREWKGEVEVSALSLHQSCTRVLLTGSRAGHNTESVRTFPERWRDESDVRDWKEVGAMAVKEQSVSQREVK